MSFELSILSDGSSCVHVYYDELISIAVRGEGEKIITFTYESTRHQSPVIVECSRLSEAHAYSLGVALEIKERFPSKVSIEEIANLPEAQVKAVKKKDWHRLDK